MIGWIFAIIAAVFCGILILGIGFYLVVLVIAILAWLVQVVGDVIGGAFED